MSEKEVELVSDLIPDALTFDEAGVTTNREVFAAKVKNKICPKCNQFGEIWNFILKPIHQHPNHLMIHRGKNSCGWRSSTIQMDKPDSWTMKE